MLGNRRGDMGFGEAAISVIAVVLVLNALVFAVVSFDSGSDPEGPDFPMLKGHVVDGGFVLDSEDYLRSYFDGNGLSGLVLKVSSPGFMEEFNFSIGSDTGYERIHSGTGLVNDDEGRSIPVIYRVYIC